MDLIAYAEICSFLKLIHEFHFNDVWKMYFFENEVKRRMLNFFKTLNGIE